MISKGFSQIWVNPLTSGRPISNYYLGDRISTPWFFQFEIGQTSWNSSEVGIGQTSDGSLGWSWSSATWYQDGTGSNKKVRRDIGNFQFTASGAWFVVGRAKANAGDNFTYADDLSWTNETTLTASTSAGFCPYFSVSDLENPTNPITVTNSDSQLTLSWAKWNNKNVMIVRKLTSDANSIAPTAGTAYSVGVGAPQLGTGTVVYNSNGTSFTDTNLSPGQSYTYTLYSENNSYYSSGISSSGVTSVTWNGTIWSNTSGPTNSIDAIINGDLPTSADLACKDLTINSGKTLTIAAGTTLSVSGNLVNNGSIVFKSNNTSTGRFGPYNGSATLGSVTMERYIDGKRAFRFLAPGVNTSGSIANNWQQQVFITGSTTVANAGGFDVTETGAPSMYTFEDSGWAAIANTGLTLNAQKGYRILIRGDRTPSILTSPSNGTMNTPVTLSATGTMITGDVPYNTLTNQDYTLVANPYISPINWATVTKNNISDTYYAWDPNLGTGNQRGRYVSCDVAGVTSIISGTGGPSTDIDQFIQPGQAVFIQKTTSGVNGSVTIKETDKAATFTDVFRTSNNSSNAINGKLGVNLYESLAYSIGEYPIDGAVVVSGTTFNTNSASDDTKKIISHGEQVAFVRDNIQLGVEKISAPQENDELSIACVNLVPNKNYVWSVVLQDDFSNEDSYLYDAFTQMYYPLTENSVISFNTTNDVNSSLVNRFKIVFQTSALTADDFVKNIKLYPNPAKAGGSFYIDGITEATVSVYNVVGQTIPVTVMSQGNAIQVTPSASLSNGVYLVSITTQGITKQVKWIVE
jgi:hypothetical protein